MSVLASSSGSLSCHMCSMNCFTLRERSRRRSRMLELRTVYQLHGICPEYQIELQMGIMGAYRKMRKKFLSSGSYHPVDRWDYMVRTVTSRRIHLSVLRLFPSTQVVNRSLVPFDTIQIWKINPFLFIY